jgi:hypothetical protein
MPYQTIAILNLEQYNQSGVERIAPPGATRIMRDRTPTMEAPATPTTSADPTGTTATTATATTSTATTTNPIDQAIAACELIDEYRAVFRAHPRLLEAIRNSIGPRHFTMIQPALTEEERCALARAGMLLTKYDRGARASLWYYGQKYLQEQWGGEQ